MPRRESPSVRFCSQPWVEVSQNAWGVASKSRTGRPALPLGLFVRSDQINKLARVRLGCLRMVQEHSNGIFPVAAERRRADPVEHVVVQARAGDFPDGLAF